MRDNEKPSLRGTKAAASALALLLALLLTFSMLANVASLRVANAQVVPAISIDPIVNPAPIWGLDSVDLTGTVEGVVTPDLYTVTVEWDDGTTTSNIPVSSGGIWSVSPGHIYGSSAAGNRNIVAKLILIGTEVPVAQSAVSSIVVQGHFTILVVDPIANVILGSDVTVTGFLIDGYTIVFDEATGEILSFELVPGKDITFDGNGADNLPTVQTDGTGVFSAAGASPYSVGDWTVNAHFAGDLAYFPSDFPATPGDPPATYSTIGNPDAVESPLVTAGQNQHVELAVPDVPASVDFGNVAQDGTFFASQCVSPDTTVQNRFIPLHYTADDDGNNNICLEIYPGLLLGAGSAIRANLSFAGSDLALPYTSNDVGVFHQDPVLGTITEVTESRVGETIVGKATSTGRFIVGVALHADAAEGAIRKPIFVGDNQQVMFRNIASIANDTATIEPLGTITLGQPVTVTINYENGNVDASAVDTLAVKINSTSSTPESITITATETAPDAEVFTGTFTPVSGPTSGSSLHVSNGDELTITIMQQSYDGRLLATLDGVGEAGFVEMKDFMIDETELPNLVFVPVAGAVDMTLVDSSLNVVSGKVTAKMSYVNALMGTYPASVLKIYHKAPGQGWAQASNIAVDTTAKTVSGETTTGGLFVVGIAVGTPGGAGGGLGKPGRGIVLDMAIAFAVQQAAGGSSGGSGSPNTSLSVTGQVSRGTDSEVTLTVTGAQSDEGNTITMTFEEVSQGRLFLTERKASELGSIFESTTPTGGSLSIGGSGFTTAGPVYDIDATEVVFSGTVDVTLPYDQSLVGSEENVRFLHHDGNAWQDATVSIDEQANTVTGRVWSLSPVVVGIVSDGTFDAAYFALNPLKKVSVLNATLSTAEFSAGAGPVEVTHAGKLELVTVSAVLKNTQRADQTYTLIVQVVDDSGITRSINFQEGSLARAQQLQVSTSWTAEEEGNYTIQVFVWDQLDRPMALTGVTTKELRAT